MITIEGKMKKAGRRRTQVSNMVSFFLIRSWGEHNWLDIYRLHKQVGGEVLLSVYRI